MADYKENLVLVPSVKEANLFPDFDKLDQYQETAAEQILYDDTDRATRTIRNLPPQIYMYLGLKEELGEMWGEDKLHPNYSRMGALVLLESEGGRLTAGERSPLSIELHTKEFGDVSWYLANALTLFNISLSDAAKTGLFMHTMRHVGAPNASPEFLEDIERSFPWTFLLGDSKSFSDAMLDVLKDDTQDRRRNLCTKAGLLLVSMAHVAQVRLDASLVEIFDGNIAKLRKRMNDGTVFKDKTGGGDTR